MMDTATQALDTNALGTGTLDTTALEGALKRAGIRRGDGWAGYERAKEIVREFAQGSAREYQAGIRFIVEYLGI